MVCHRVAGFWGRVAFGDVDLRDHNSGYRPTTTTSGLVHSPQDRGRYRSECPRVETRCRKNCHWLEILEAHCKEKPCESSQQPNNSKLFTMNEWLKNNVIIHVKCCMVIITQIDISDVKFELLYESSFLQAFFTLYIMEVLLKWWNCIYN